MKISYFDQLSADTDDIALNLAKGQGYVPANCLLGGTLVMSIAMRGADPCIGCEGPRSKCHGRPKESKNG
jgi:hypothetical protein